MDNNHVRNLIASITPNKRIEDSIDAAVISDEEISDNASSTLAGIRRRIRAEQESLKDKLNSMIHSSKYQKYMQESLVTIRGDRYVIPVKAEYRNEIPGLVHDSSASGATVYIEPMSVVEANNNIKQLRIKEQLEIERILQELTGEVAGIIEPLKTNMTMFAQLDYAFAKARLSLDLDCVCPKLNRDKRINIKKGRHPLLDKNRCTHRSVDRDDFTTLVITGPNTGGKTVTLKPSACSRSWPSQDCMSRLRRARRCACLAMYLRISAMSRASNRVSAHFPRT